MANIELTEQEAAKLFLMQENGYEIDKDKIAELLSISKEALEAFEKEYSSKVLNSEYVSENFFDVNSRQASAAIHKSIETSVPELESLKSRIVNELIAKSFSWKFDGSKIIENNTIKPTIDNPVTLEEVNALPKELRPQLTGNLMKVDIGGPTYLVLLDMYRQYLEEKDPMKKRYYYFKFRQGLDILDIDEITHKIISTNKTSMGHWLPEIVRASLSTGTLMIPKTIIVKIPTTMLQLTRCEYTDLTPTTFEIVNDFCRQTFELDESLEYFIKTGTYSSKFDFRNAYVHEAKEVREIGEYLLFVHNQALQMASPLTKPCIYGVSTTDEWVVREFIKDKENNPCIYKGLPLHTEYRVFADFDTKEIIGISPYWEPNTMKNRFGNSNDSNSPHNKHDYIIYKMHEPILMKRYFENKDKVLKHVQELINKTEGLTGQWSIDVMQNGEDFWIIDMAIAENSALYDCVPKVLRKPQPENWIPILK